MASPMQKACKAEALPRIKTFIFFDLETTGLIKSANIPEITEISLIAVDRDHVLINDSTLPRVLNKLVIPINPCKNIPPIVTRLTKLSNMNLKNAKRFQSATYELLMQFIKILPSPVCFVAHNGNKFDYPIILEEFQRIGKDFPEEILCIDTLIAFKDFSDKSEIDEEDSNPPQSNSHHGPKMYSAINRDTDGNYNPSFKNGLDEEFDGGDDSNYNPFLNNGLNEEFVGGDFCPLQNNSHCPEVYPTTDCDALGKYNFLLEDGLDDELSRSLDTVINVESMGNQSTSSCYEVVVHRTLNVNNLSAKIFDANAIDGNRFLTCKEQTMQEKNEKTPTRQIIKRDHVKNKRLHKKKESTLKKRIGVFYKKPINFKLSTLYEHLIGHPPEHAHTAEGDCLTMLQCVSKLGSDFLKWADCNATPLISYRMARM